MRGRYAARSVGWLIAGLRKGDRACRVTSTAGLVGLGIRSGGGKSLYWAIGAFPRALSSSFSRVRSTSLSIFGAVVSTPTA
jgi:hypothetical protein